MKEFVDKLIERLKESRKSLKVGQGKKPATFDNLVGWVNGHDKAIEIVNQLAEEYKQQLPNDLEIVSSLPSLYPLQDFEEKAIHRVVGNAERIAGFEELEQYRVLEQKLQSVYGEHRGLLESVVNGLVQYENAPDTARKAVLLTDEDAERWEQYRAIGSVEQCSKAMENMTNPSTRFVNPAIQEATLMHEPRHTVTTKIKEIMCDKYGLEGDCTIDEMADEIYEELFKIVL